MCRVECAGSYLSSSELPDETSFCCCFPTAQPCFHLVLLGSFSSSSLLLCSLFILSLKLPDHPRQNQYRPEPVRLVSAEGGLSLSTWVLSTSSLAGGHWAHPSSPDTREGVLAITTSAQSRDGALAGHHPLQHSPSQ